MEKVEPPPRLELCSLARLVAKRYFKWKRRIAANR
jgi:hypothetical protein